MKLEFSQQFLEKYRNMKFHEISLVEAEFLHANGRTEGHSEANSRFSEFCEGA